MWCYTNSLALSIARTLSNSVAYRHSYAGYSIERNLESLCLCCFKLANQNPIMSASPVQPAVSPLSPPPSDHNRRTPAADAVSTKSHSPSGTASSAGSKRKRDADPKLYAVRTGHKPGVYFSWSDCLAQVKGFRNATCEYRQLCQTYLTLNIRSEGLMSFDKQSSHLQQSPMLKHSLQEETRP